MPINIYKREADNRAGDAILGLVQGFTQGRKMRTDAQDQSLANAYKLAQIKELERKSEALSAPAPVGYVRDQATGELKEDLGAMPNFFQQGGGKSPIPKSFKVGRTEYVNPDYAEFELEQKRLEESQKPLSAEAAVKLEGGRQSLQQAQEIRRLVNEGNFKDIKSGVGKIRAATSLGLNQPGSIRGGITDYLTGGLARGLFKTTDEQKKAELAINLIAENNVRAKSGAAVPEPEQVREEARQLLADDSFKSFLHRLVVSEEYNRGTIESIRPGSSKSIMPKGQSKYQVVAVE